MINCIKNEILKLIHNKKFYVYFFAIVMLIIVKIIFMYNSSFNKTPSEKLKGKEKLFIELKTDIKNEALSKEKKKNIDRQIKQLNEEIKELKYSIAYPNEEWENTIKKKIQNLEKDKKELSEDLDPNIIEKYNGEIQYYKYLLNNGIEPNKEYKIYAFQNIIDVFDFINKMILPILIAFLCSGIIASEYTFSTIKMLLTKPVSRKKIYLSKFLSYIGIVSITIFFIEFIAFIIMGCIFDFGSASYPISVGTKYTQAFNNKVHINGFSAIIGSSYIVPAWKVILLNLLMQFIFIVACISFVMLISTIFPNNIISLTINLAILTLISILTYILPFKFLSKVYPMLFTTYSCATDVIRGNLAVSLNSTIININLGIFVIAIWSVICYLVSSRIFNKRDVLT